jgi:hypothetical protein
MSRSGSDVQIFVMYSYGVRPQRVLDERLAISYRLRAPGKPGRGGAIPSNSIQEGHDACRVLWATMPATVSSAMRDNSSAVAPSRACTDNPCCTTER